MSLISTLLKRPTDLSPVAKFTYINGFLYIAAGALLLLWPGAVQTLFMETEFIGREAGLMRAIAMSLIVIGWFYVFGGRSGATQFVAASIIDRITIVPIVLTILAISGVFPRVFLSLAVLDPILGLITWYLLKREQ